MTHEGLCAKFNAQFYFFYGVKKCVFKNILHAIKNFMILHPLIVIACHIGDSICHTINLVNFFNGHWVNDEWDIILQSSMTNMEIFKI